MWVLLLNLVTILQSSCACRFHVDQVAHVNVNIWEEALHLGQVVVSTVGSMATGQGTVRLVTGKTNATDVAKEAT